MKKIKFFYCLLAALVIIGCDSDDDSGMPSGNIIADFEFTNDESTFSFTNLSQGGSTYQWDFGDLYFYSQEENPIYTYAIGGELVVSLTVTSECGEKAIVSKSITAPEIIIIEIEIDGDFEDWENVEYHTEDLAGSSIQKMKVWTKGSDINFYFEGNSSMQMELIDMYFNSDGDSTTGLSGFGADYLFEGPVVVGGWGAFYKHNDPTGGWGWDWLAGSGANLVPSAIVSISADVNAIEFRIPKTQFGSLGATIDISITEMTAGWGLVGEFPAAEPYTTIEL